MKFWVRITVATLAVIAVAFAVWAFFFKEKDEVVAFNKTTELVEYKESLGIQAKFIDLYNTNYLGEDKSNIINSSTEVNKDILIIRQNSLSQELIVGYDEFGVEIGEYDSYFVVEGYIDNAIQFYLPYLNSNNKNNKLKKQVTKSIDEYIESLQVLSSSIDTVLLCHKEITGTDVEMQVLKGHYTGFYSKYRDSMYKASSVIKSLVDYINECVYKGEFKADTRSALYDCYARALQASTTSDNIIEDYYLHDLHLIADKIDAIDKGESIYDSYSEYSFLTSYNKVAGEYSSTLTNVLGMKNYIKIQMAEGNELSSVNEKVQNEIVVILNVLGY